MTRSLTASSPFATTASPGTLGRSISTMARTFLGQVEPVVPGLTSRWNGKAAASLWHLNPYTRGAYSYWSPGYCQQYSGYESIRRATCTSQASTSPTTTRATSKAEPWKAFRAANEIYTYAK